MQLRPAPEKDSDNHKTPVVPSELQKEPETKPQIDREPSKPKRKWMGKRTAIALMAAVLLGAGGTGYLAMKKSAPKADISALTVPVESQNITVQIKASGIVRPVQTVNLSPKNSGRIAELNVEQGDWVEAGQLIARMDNEDVRAELIQAEGNLAAAKARLEKLQAGSRSEEIAEAQARVAKARSTLAELQAGSRPEEIAEARASVARAQAQVQEARSRLELASERVRRNEQLYSEGAIARDDLDQALDEQQRASASVEQFEAGVREATQRQERLQNGTRSEDIAQAQADVDQAQSQLDLLLNGTRPEEIAQAEAEVQQAEGRVQAVEVQLEDKLIRAPFAGQITQKYATVGSFVTPTTSASETSSATSTSVVALARGLEILAKVPEADIGQIKPGQSVEIVADAYPEEVFKGKVRLIAPEAVKERDVTLFQVRVDIESGTERLQSGMNVNLTFLGNRVNDALVVPTVAIVTKKGESGVLVPDEKNKPTFRPVTIGTQIGDRVQILQGVRAGEQIFISLPEGQKMEDVLK